MKKLQNRLPHFIQKCDPKGETFGSFTLHQVADRSHARISAAHPEVSATDRAASRTLRLRNSVPHRRSQRPGQQPLFCFIHCGRLRSLAQFPSGTPGGRARRRGFSYALPWRRLRLMPSLSPSVSIDQTPDRFDASSSDGREMHGEQATSRRYGRHGDDLRGDLPAILRAGSCQGTL